MLKSLTKQDDYDNTCQLLNGKVIRKTLTTVEALKLADSIKILAIPLMTVLFSFLLYNLFNHYAVVHFLYFSGLPLFLQLLLTPAEPADIEENGNLSKRSATDRRDAETAGLRCLSVSMKTVIRLSRYSFACIRYSRLMEVATRRR